MPPRTHFCKIRDLVEESCPHERYHTISVDGGLISAAQRRQGDHWSKIICCTILTLQCLGKRPILHFDDPHKTTLFNQFKQEKREENYQLMNHFLDIISSLRYDPTNQFILGLLHSFLDKKEEEDSIEPSLDRLASKVKEIRHSYRKIDQYDPSWYTLDDLQGLMACLGLPSTFYGEAEITAAHYNKAGWSECVYGQDDDILWAGGTILSQICTYHFRVIRPEVVLHSLYHRPPLESSSSSEEEDIGKSQKNEEHNPLLEAAFLCGGGNMIYKDKKTMKFSKALSLIRTHGSALKTLSHLLKKSYYPPDDKDYYHALIDYYPTFIKMYTPSVIISPPEWKEIQRPKLKSWLEKYHLDSYYPYFLNPIKYKDAILKECIPILPFPFTTQHVELQPHAIRKLITIPIPRLQN